GTIFNSATTEFVASASRSVVVSADWGASPPFAPPVIRRKASLDVGLVGLTIVNQCCQTGRSTSSAVRQVCDLRSITNCVSELPSAVRTTFHEYVASGLAT